MVPDNTSETHGTVEEVDEEPDVKPRRDGGSVDGESDDAEEKAADVCDEKVSE